MHPDYDHFYIPLTFKYNIFQPQTNIFPGNNNPFSLKPSTVVWVTISEKKTHQFSRSEISLYTYFKVGEIMVSKFEHLMLPGVFPDKTTPVIDFADKTVVQCDIQVIKYFRF